MAEHLETGKKAEDIAANFLIEKGYQILHRNYRYGRAEIDLIVQKGIFLVFVEVKSLTNLKFGMPEIGVNKHKVAMVTKAADFYVYKNNWHQQIRFDIVAVIFRNDNAEVSHFEDAFY
jgi:putative endonuclease